MYVNGYPLEQLSLPGRSPDSPAAAAAAAGTCSGVGRYGQARCGGLYPLDGFEAGESAALPFYGPGDAEWPTLGRLVALAAAAADETEGAMVLLLTSLGRGLAE